MTKELLVTTYIRVEEEDENLCGHNCPHKEFLFQHRCRLFGEMLKRNSLGKGLGFQRCFACLKAIGGKDGHDKAGAGEPSVRAGSRGAKKPRR